MEILSAAFPGAFLRSRNRVSGARRYGVFVLVAMMLLALVCGIAKAQATSEYAIKGAFLVKFGAFVEWPADAFPSPSSPFVIGILGEDPFGAELDRSAQGAMVQGRPVVIKRYQRVEQSSDAHILYISATTQERREQLLSWLRSERILTVSDKSALPGGIINFVIQDNKVRFEIDAEAAERAGLKLSSKLLALAKVEKK
jgi:hypothetical protein